MVSVLPTQEMSCAPAPEGPRGVPLTVGQHVSKGFILPKDKATLDSVCSNKSQWDSVPWNGVEMELVEELMPGVTTGTKHHFVVVVLMDPGNKKRFYVRIDRVVKDGDREDRLQLYGSREDAYQRFGSTAHKVRNTWKLFQEGDRLKERHWFWNFFSSHFPNTAVERTSMPVILGCFMRVSEKSDYAYLPRGLRAQYSWNVDKFANCRDFARAFIWELAPTSVPVYVLVGRSLGRMHWYDKYYVQADGQSVSF